jgi:hypothetical protein
MAAVCLRCGRFMCGACIEADGLCRACVIRRQHERPSTLAKAALTLGILGISGLLLPGVVALVLARIELKRIAEGQAPTAGRPFARGARIMGWFCTALLAALALWAIRSTLDLEDNW